MVKQVKQAWEVCSSSRCMMIKPACCTEAGPALLGAQLCLAKTMCHISLLLACDNASNKSKGAGVCHFGCFVLAISLPLDLSQQAHKDGHRQSCLQSLEPSKAG